jgi:hypothetical protein
MLPHLSVPRIGNGPEMTESPTSLHPLDEAAGPSEPEDVTSVFVPSPEARARRRQRVRGIALALVSVIAVMAVAVMVAWPRLNPRSLDPAERVAEAYLQALVQADLDKVGRLGTVLDPPAIRAVRNVTRDRSGDRVLKGSFAPVGDFHGRIEAEYAYDAASGRYTPRNPLGAAAETLDALHAAKEDAEKSNLAEKILSGSPDDLFDAAEQLAKSLAGLSKGALAPQRILPSYRMLIDAAQPPLPEDAKVLALEVAASPKRWEALLKRPFSTLKADGPFICEWAEVNATAADRLSSMGDPPTCFRLSLVRFRLEMIDTGWRVVEARRVRPGESDQSARASSVTPAPRASRSAGRTDIIP